MLKYILAILFNVPILVCYAQNDALFRRLTIRDGLSSNVVNAILTDDKGFVWIGTAFGLNKYDGVKFTKFYHSSNNKNSLLDDEISSLAQDKFNTIWIATAGGLCYVNTDEGDLVHRIDHIEEKQIQFTENRFYIENGTKLWMQNNSKVCCYNITGVGKLKLSHEITLPKQPSYEVNFITSDKRAGIIVGTDFGVYRVKAGNNNANEILNTENGPLIKSCYVISDSVVWLGSYLKGLIKCNLKTLDLQYYKFNKDTLEGKGLNSVSDIIPQVDPYKLWIASRDKGLISFNTLTKQFICYEEDQLNPFSLSSNGARKVCHDKLNNLWIGTDAGLDILDFKTQFIKQHYLPWYSNRPQDRVINCVFPIQNSKLFCIGTNGKGAMLYDSDNRTFIQINAPDKNTLHNFQLSNVRSIASNNFSPNTLWIISNNGLFKLNIETKILSLVADENFQKGGYFSILFFDAETLTLTTNTELKIYNIPKNKWTTIQIDKIDFYAVLPIVKINSEKIWAFCGNQNVQEIDIYSGTKTNISLAGFNIGNNNLQINSIVRESPESCLLLTSNGLWRLKPAEKTMERINLGGDPRLKFISKGIKDKYGNFWLSGKEGLIFFNPKNNLVKYYGSNFNVFNSAILSEFSIDKSGLIFYGQRQMYYYFDPSDLKQSNTVSSGTIRYTYISVNDKELPVLYYGNKVKPLELDANQNNIRFDFSALDFKPSGYNTYFYKLIGVSDSWISCGQNTNVMLTNLRGGKYTLSIRARDPFGRYSSSPAVIVFKIKLHFYETWWFYLLCFFITVLIVYIIYRFRVNQLIALERVRVKIATDLHDDVGSELSSISILSDFAREKITTDKDQANDLMKTIGERSRETIENMSDIIWAIKPKNDTIQQVLIRMKQFAFTILEARNNVVRFEVNPNILRVKLNMELRRNLYLIFKEAVNNIAKYSSSKNVNISIKINKKSLIISIFDDGQGFETKSNELGNGLSNMEMRAKQCKGTVKIESQIGKGTSVTATFPVT